MRVIMSIVSVVMSLLYVFAGVLRAYVGWVAMKVRRVYWVTVPACFGQAFIQLSLLWIRPASEARTIFAQTLSALIVSAGLIGPAFVAHADALRDRALGLD